MPRFGGLINIYDITVKMGHRFLQILEKNKTEKKNKKGKDGGKRTPFIFWFLVFIILLAANIFHCHGCL